MKEQLKKFAGHATVQRLASLCIGLAVGLVAWRADAPPLPAILLPLVVAAAGSRAQAFLIALGYSMGVTRSSVDFSWSWFDGNVLYTALIWMGAALLGGLGWSLAWTASEKPWRKALAQALAWTVTLLPPLAILTNGHVLPAWGFLLQGWFWVGVAASVGLPMVHAFLIARHRVSVMKVRAELAVVFVGLAVVAAGMQPPDTRYVDDVVGVSTHWGKAKGYPDVLDRMYRMGVTDDKLAEAGATVVFWPESILQTYSPDMAPFIDEYIIKGAAAQSLTVVLGTDVTMPDGNLQSTAIAYYPDGRTATAVARQPVPFVLWRPWQAKDAYKLDWTASPVLTLRQGAKARIVFCYEEYIPMLALIDEATRDYRFVVAMANTWAASSATSSAIQRWHSQGMALLFAKRFIRAENRAKKPAVSTTD